MSPHSEKMLNELSRRVSFKEFYNALYECTSTAETKDATIPSVHRDNMLSDTPEVISNLFDPRTSAKDIALLIEFVVSQFDHAACYGSVQFSLSGVPIFRVILSDGFTYAASVDLGKFIDMIQMSYASRHPAFLLDIHSPKIANPITRFLISDSNYYYHIQDVDRYLHTDKDDEKQAAPKSRFLCLEFESSQSVQILKQVLFAMFLIGLVVLSIAAFGLYLSYKSAL